MKNIAENGIRKYLHMVLYILKVHMWRNFMKNENITKLRVFATLLVVIGHAIIIYDPYWTAFDSIYSSSTLYYLKQFINLIQMPIFMFISGYLYFGSWKREKYKNIFSIIKDKFNRLIIPFFAIAALLMIPVRILVKSEDAVKNGYLKTLLLSIVGRSSGHLWFLPTLFLIFIIAYLVIKYIKIKDIYILILFLIISIISVKLPSIFFISRVAKYLCYFYIGFIIAKFNVKFSNKNKIMICILFILMSALSIFVLNGRALNNIIQLVCGIMGVFSSYFICDKIKMNKFINVLNKDSFAIYLIHSPITYIIFNEFANIKPFLLVTLNIVVSIGLSIAIAKLLRILKLNFILGE